MSFDPHALGKWHAAMFNDRRWYQPKSSESDCQTLMDQSLKDFRLQEVLGDGEMQSVPLAD